MTEEKVIETLKKLTRCKGLNVKILDYEIEAIQGLLDLYEKLREELQKQSKVIDEMASILLKTYRDWEVFRFEFQNHICKKMINPKIEEDDCYTDIYDDNACKECIKQYFYRKVE